MQTCLSKSKYGSKKITRDGITFDSQKEYRRFCELSLLQKAGTITDLKRQVEFELIPAQREPDTVGVRGGIKKGKVIEHKCSYVADFVYKENGKLVVEDVKGYKKGTAYNLFSIKRKLMLLNYGIRIKET